MPTSDTEIILAVLEEKFSNITEKVSRLEAVVQDNIDEQRDTNKDLGERVSNVEMDVKFVRRVAAPVIAIATAAVNAWISLSIKGS